MTPPSQPFGPTETGPNNASGAGESPWPVYQPGAPAGPNPTEPNAGANPWQQPTASPGQHGASGYSGPAGYSNPGNYGAPANQGAPGAYPTGGMPKRTGAIWTLVLGIVAAVIIAPLVFVLIVVTPMLSSVTGMMATNGGQVTIGDDGYLAVAGASSVDDVGECVLTSSSGVETPSVPDAIIGYPSFSDVTPGQYLLFCDGAPEGDDLIVMDGAMIDSVINRSVTALIVSTVIGVGGIVAFIVGLVWLVRRNGARRDYQRSQWGPGPGYYPQV